MQTAVRTRPVTGSMHHPHVLCVLVDAQAKCQGIPAPSMKFPPRTESANGSPGPPSDGGFSVCLGSRGHCIWPNPSLPCHRANQAATTREAGATDGTSLNREGLGFTRQDHTVRGRGKDVEGLEHHLP